jgi:hypothetical protein
MRATMDGPATGCTTLKTGKITGPPAARGRDPTTLSPVRILGRGAFEAPLPNLRASNPADGVWSASGTSAQ